LDQNRTVSGPFLDLLCAPAVVPAVLEQKNPFFQHTLSSSILVSDYAQQLSPSINVELVAGREVCGRRAAGGPRHKRMASSSLFRVGIALPSPQCPRSTVSLTCVSAHTCCSNSAHSISRSLSRVKSGGGVASLLAMAGRIACKDANLFHAFLGSRP